MIENIRNMAMTPAYAHPHVCRDSGGGGREESPRLQKFLATVTFEACSVLDHSCFLWFFLNDFFSTKIPLKAVLDQKTCVYFAVYTFPTPPPPTLPAALPYLSFPIILYTMTLEISSQDWINYNSISR